MEERMPKGMYSRYQSIKDRRISPLAKVKPEVLDKHYEENKVDLNIKPVRTVKYMESSNNLKRNESPYEILINEQVVRDEASPPKFTFRSKEYYA